MISTEELSELLAALYSAPLQPEKWQVFFDHLARLTKTTSGYLITTSESQGRKILAGGGLAFNPEVIRLYNEHYAPADPFAAPTFGNPRTAVFQGEELVSRNQLRKTEFYSDLLRGNEMEHLTVMSFSSAAELTGVMPVWRRGQDGPMDEASIALLRILLPHAHNANRIRKTLEESEACDHFADLALDAMSCAAFLVTSTSRVQQMNKLASAIIEEADGLRLERATLKASDPVESAQLEFFISGAASGSSRGKSTPPGGALTISRREMEQPLHVTILPVPESRRSMVAVPSALVFVSDPAVRPKSRAVFMKMMYGLTPAESRFADLLLQGLEVGEIADRLGITIETARCHLKRVLAKTGTRRQTELIRLMLSLPGTTVD
jgi:DNA-binding CsgD family transcriptional regulator